MNFKFQTYVKAFIEIILVIYHNSNNSKNKIYLLRGILTNLSISLEGIGQAIKGLAYKENSKKYKVISAINDYYVSAKSIDDVVSIDTDTLIKKIWNLKETPSKIKTKRRNFSSLKSSINKDLKKLSDKGKNPENIVITDSNIFDMSEEAKANLLKSAIRVFH